MTWAFTLPSEAPVIRQKSLCDAAARNCTGFFRVYAKNGLQNLLKLFTWTYIKVRKLTVLKSVIYETLGCGIYFIPSSDIC